MHYREDEAREILRMLSMLDYAKCETGPDEPWNLPTARERELQESEEGDNE